MIILGYLPLLLWFVLDLLSGLFLHPRWNKLVIDGFISMHGSIIHDVLFSCIVSLSYSGCLLVSDSLSQFEFIWRFVSLLFCVLIAEYASLTPIGFLIKCDSLVCQGLIPCHDSLQHSGFILQIGSIISGGLISLYG